MKVRIERTWQPGHQPGWRCPACGYGTIEIKEGRLLVQDVRSRTEIALSRDDPGAPRRFSALASCNRCELPVSIAGLMIDVLVPPSHEDDDEDDWITDFHAFHVDPPPHLLPRLARLPQAFTPHVRRVETLFWVDDRACASAIRCLIEAFLDDQGIAQVSENKGSAIKTHHRIEAYSKLTPLAEKAADRLMAIKWLGNSGSHSNNIVSKNDIDLALNLVERVLILVYDDTDEQLDAQAKRLMARHGPKPRKKA